MCSGVPLKHQKKVQHVLGPPVVPFNQLFLGRVPLLKLTTEQDGTLILTSLLADLVLRNSPMALPVSQVKLAEQLDVVEESADGNQTQPREAL